MKKILISAALLLIISIVTWVKVENKTSLTVKKTPGKKTKISSSKPQKVTSTIPLNANPEDSPYPEVIHEVIHQILNKKLSFIQRTKDILSLRQMTLTKADEQALINHLLKPHEDEAHTIQNDLIEHLVRYGKDSKIVGDTLLAILKNEQQSPVIREYILQYVPEYYLSRWQGAENWGDIEEIDRQKFNSIMWRMTEFREHSMAGGALFALHRISALHQDLNPDKINQKSHDVLTDPSYSNPNRMAAVQILAFSNREEYYETARKIVMEKEGSILLQVTAIHTAIQSQRHNKPFHQYLVRLSKGTDPTLRKCAQLNLMNLKRN